MFDKGFFGDLFDLDGDGKLDTFEQALELATFMELMDEGEQDSDELVDFNL